MQPSQTVEAEVGAGVDVEIFDEVIEANNFYYLNFHFETFRFLMILCRSLMLVSVILAEVNLN